MVRHPRVRPWGLKVDQLGSYASPSGGDDHGVAVEIVDPDLTVSRTVSLPLGRVPVWRPNDRGAELLGTRDDLVKGGNLPEPEQHSVSHLARRITDLPVMVSRVPLMKLEDQSAVRSSRSYSAPPWSL